MIVLFIVLLFHQLVVFTNTYTAGVKKTQGTNHASREGTHIFIRKSSTYGNIRSILNSKFVHKSVEDLGTPSNYRPIIEDAEPSAPEACRIAIDIKLLTDFLIRVDGSHLSLDEMALLADIQTH